MKKRTLILPLFLVLALSACSSIFPSNDPASMNQTGTPSGELPVTTQLLLGTFKLEDTDNALTMEQAAELLPLWQTLQVLSESDTAANQEEEALITQIQETMTPEQMQAITEMNISREDMMSIMQEQGMTMGAGPTGTQNNNAQNGNSSTNSGPNFGPGGGEMPPPDERGFPGGGPGMGPSGGGQNLSAEQIATAQAARQAAGGTMIPPGLINALIEFLKQKAGA